MVKKEKTLSQMGIDEMTKKNRWIKYLTYFCLALSFVLMVTYFIYTVITSQDVIEQLATIIGVSILALFTLFFLIISLFADNPKGRIYVIIASLLLSLYSGFQLLVAANWIKLPSQSYVLNFYGKDITEVIEWAEANKISVEQVYENSDSLEMYKIMSQDVAPGTLVKDIDKIVVTVSDGPDQEKEAAIPDMIGWSVDEVADFVEENFLTNVEINFEFRDDVKKDVIFEQENENDDEMKRNSKITLKASLGKEEDLESVAMINLVGKDLFHGSLWLKRNAISYTVEYGYSEEYEEGTIIKQSITKGKIIDKERTKEVVITVSRQKDITIPDFSNMSASEITSWATDNHLKVEFKEEFDDSVEEGKVIRSSKIKGDVAQVNDTIRVVISKGQIRMIKFTNVDDFKKWAEENEVSYHIDYSFDSSVESGKLISSSHKEGDLIKNTDTISLVISQGGTTTVPNFIGKTKAEAETLCEEANLTCSFTTASSEETKDTVIKQSMKKDSEVPNNTTITITLSSGK